MPAVPTVSERLFRRLNPRGHRAKLLQRIREVADSHSMQTDSQLLQAVHEQKTARRVVGEVGTLDLLVGGLALACEALRRSKGIQLYDVQLIAAMELAQGRIAQMQTGEGKTFVAIASAAVLALEGQGVHVMTPNSYLAERDAEEAAPVLSVLGMDVGLTVEQDSDENKYRAYCCDVTYGTGHEFGFDYLRDQVTLKKQAAAVPGSQLLERLVASNLADRETLQRGLNYAIVDEADSVMIDDAGSPLVLSASVPGEAPDAEVHRQARQLVLTMESGTDFHIEPSSGVLKLLPAGKQLAKAASETVPANQLLRPWREYLQQALRAEYLFLRDVHYIVQDESVKIVDGSTGRIFDDRSWQDGLHQAIQVKERVVIEPEMVALARISRQRLYRQYDFLCGMTGTATGCEAEFRQIYRRIIAPIPLNRPSQRNVLPMRCFVSTVAKFKAICDEIRLRHPTGQAILVGTQSIADSESLAEELAAAGLPFQILNGLQSAEEAEVVATAGRPYSITLATNLAGRGTDIAISEEVLAVGGLHVIVTECQISSRMDRQLTGRCGRQGQPGSCQTFVSSEDELLQKHGDWLASAIKRDARGGEEARSSFEPAVRRIQASAERQQYLSRLNLLQQETSVDELLKTG
ncbi:MAG: DEAD/DEAH box helicase [Fuerstiella sp.]